MSDMQSQSNSSSFPDSLDPIQRRNHEESKRLAIAASDAAKRAERELAEAKSAVVAKFGLPQIDLSTISNPRLAHSLLSRVADEMRPKDNICFLLTFCASNTTEQETAKHLGNRITDTLLSESNSVIVNGWMRAKIGGLPVSFQEAYHLRLAWIDAMQFQLEQMI